jgi:spermidine/putrescine-binding protein
MRSTRTAIGLAAAGLTLSLTACSGSATPATTDAGTPAAAAPTSAAGGAADLKGQTLNLYSWSEYIPQEALDRFSDQTGVQINYDTYASNEELLAKLKAGGANYDVIVPSDYLVGLMREEGLLTPLDKAKLANVANLDSRFLDQQFDPGNQFTVPYQWGTTGIVSNQAKVQPPITSFADLWRADLKDRLVVLDDQREMLGIALVQLGLDRNSTDPDDLAKARDKLIALKPNIRVFDSDSPKSQLLAGEVDAGVVYNGEAALLERENPDFKYLLPADGCGVWFDNLAIPTGAPHPDVAHAFIDFMLAPEQSLLVTRDFPYSNPNTAGLKLLEAELPELHAAYQASAATNPSAEAVAKCQPVLDVGAALPIYGDMWTEVKGSR